MGGVFDIRILVTGGAGFIGSHICEYYASEGDEVIAFDNLCRVETLKTSTKNPEAVYYNWNYLKRFRNVKLVHGDIRKFVQLFKILKKGIDIVFHTAAQVAVTSSIEDPLTDYQINAIGTFNLCEAARRAKVEPIILMCSTNKVYGDLAFPLREEKTRYVYDGVEAIDESYPLQANCPYGASKICAEMVLQSYFLTYGIPTIRARMSCIYGPRQIGCEDQAWIAHFVISTLTNRPITIYGDGKQVRDALYVIDLVRAFDLLVKQSGRTAGEAYNIGGGPTNTISLHEMLSVLSGLTEKKSQVKFSSWRKGDQKIYISDISKLQSATGWKPRMGIEEGIKNLVTWTEANISLFL